jgi:hypothetical protein
MCTARYWYRYIPTGTGTVDEGVAGRFVLPGRWVRVWQVPVDVFTF